MVKIMRNETILKLLYYKTRISAWTLLPEYRRDIIFRNVFYLKLRFPGQPNSKKGILFKQLLRL